jgi:hypothetical protein
MSTIVNLLIIAILSLGSGYAVKEFLSSVEKTSIEKVDQGLSGSESFARKLTGKGLEF